MSDQHPPIIDPNAAAEAAKYDNPVPSRDALMAFMESLGRPVTHPELCEQLAETDEDRIEAIRRRLIAMARDGQLISNRRNQFALISKVDLVTGIVLGHKDGFGYVLREDAPDVFLSHRQMRRVFHGDKVAVQVMGVDRRGKPEGRIVDVLERNTHQVVGRYMEQGGVGVVIPDNKRMSHEIVIAAEHRNAAQHGQFVVADIIEQPKAVGVAVGQVREVLGEHLAPGMEIDVAIRSHDIPYQWPQAALAEADKLPTEVHEADKLNRIDLRHLPFVTIDGEDARDFDDAVYCEPNKRTGGWRLYVAIADVSHYVTVGSALDQEAHKRGNSVYFPDNVIPMLPEKLSNGLCSLNPHTDRLVMVCEMTISAKGAISGFCFSEAVMHSHARLTYNQVWAMLQTPTPDDGAVLRNTYRELIPHLEHLYDLFKLLRHSRELRGALDFDSQETRIIFDDERKIENIVPTSRNDAHMLIEECMLAANVCTARFLEKQELDSLYRVHNGPSEEKLEKLKVFLGELGLSLKAPGSKTRDIEPSDFQYLLQHIEGRDDQHVIQTVMLRSLSQAVYQPDNNGHFGLAYKAYTHFTSPIRRYPDLLTHRAIRSIIRSDKECRHVRRAEGATPLNKQSIYPYDMARMLQLGEHCSLTERRADDATRDVIDFLKCEYLSDRIGETFDGIISTVTGFGLFVGLNDVFVEGLVHISSLPGDYYQFDANSHRLVGERTRRVFRLGDTVNIRVVRVDIDEKKIDFELTETSNNKPKTRKKLAKPTGRSPRKRKISSENKDTKSIKKTKTTHKKSESKKKAKKKSAKKAKKK